MPTIDFIDIERATLDASLFSPNEGTLKVSVPSSASQLNTYFLVSTFILGSYDYLTEVSFLTIVLTDCIGDPII